MSHHSSDPQQKAKLQRPGNRFKTQQKVDQHKIDEILGQELPNSPPRVNISNDIENAQSSKPIQHVSSYQGNTLLPGTNKSNKNQKLPVLPPLGSSKKPEYHSIQRPPQRASQQSHQKLSNDAKVHFPSNRRNSNESNHSNNSNGQRSTFELPKLPKKIDKLGISADLSDLENSESCSSAPEEFKKTLPKIISKSNSIDNFNLTSTTILDDFFHSSDDSDYGSNDDNEAGNTKNKTHQKNESDDDIISDDDFSFDEIISDSDDESDQAEKKKKYRFLTTQELQLCKDTQSVHNEVKQRLDKLIKIARNHFPATKDNTVMLTRLVEQSRACHEFHFLEKRTKYYESENRGLTITLSSLEDFLSNPQSSSGNNNNIIINKVKFGLQRLNALQMRQAKRMTKELSQAQHKIKKLRAEISKLHAEMRASARRGGDGSLLIAEMSNNGNSNQANVANFGGGSGADDDELAALKVEHQFSVAKEKAAVGVMQKENEELERIINTYEKRIVLMTQKESNYSRLFKKCPTNASVKSNSSPKSQKPENKKETSPSHHPDNKNVKQQKQQKRNSQIEAQKLPVKKDSAAKKTAQSSPKKKKKEEAQEEVPIIEVLSI